MKLKQTLLIAGLAGGLIAGPVAHADETSEIIKTLRQQIDVLDQKVRVLERKQELAHEASHRLAGGGIGEVDFNHIPRDLPSAGLDVFIAAGS